jgi:hypothetical protein
MFAGGSQSSPPEQVVISAIDRLGNESALAAAVVGAPPIKKPAPAKRRRKS